MGDRLLPRCRLAIMLQLREACHQVVHGLGYMCWRFKQCLMGVIQQAGCHDFCNVDAYQRG